jgi:hypothetical protein
MAEYLMNYYCNEVWFKASSYCESFIQWQCAYVCLHPNFSQCFLGYFKVYFGCFDLRMTQHTNEALERKQFVS